MGFECNISMYKFEVISGGYIIFSTNEYNNFM